MKNIYYKYFNPNPLGKETNDCVIRSICAVTGKSWFDVYDELSEQARIIASPFTGWNLEEKDKIFSEKYNAQRCKITKTKGVNSVNVEKFCKNNPTGKYILRLAHHLMAVIDGQYYEINPGWEKSKVYTYWKII